MKINVAYLQLIKTSLKGNYIKSGGRLIFDNGFSWAVAFQSMDKRNFCIVKGISGVYSVKEI